MDDATKTVKLAFILFLAIFSTGFARRVQASPALPTAQGTMQWLPKLKTFAGEMAFELRQPHTETEFALYPNRYLSASLSSDRQSVEAYTESQPLWERTFLRQRAALILRKAQLRTLDAADCRNGNLLQARIHREESTNLKFDGTETVVTVSGNSRPISASQCLIVHFEFQFSPQNAAGNFGIVSPTEMRFAGPIFPFPMKHLYKSEVTFAEGNVLCADCETLSNKTVLRFQSFPSPLHFLNEPASLSFREINSVQLTFLDGGDKDLVSTIENIVRNKLLQLPFFQKGIHQKKMYVVKDALVHNVVSRQFGEIELGTGFFKISPLFRGYHIAAFERAFLTEFFLQEFQSQKPATTSSELREIYTLSRWLAELQVRDNFESIDTVKNISSFLSFIPIFNDIVKGKALVNNLVYLGLEEGENPTDTLPFHAVFPTFSGRELEERAQWCLGDQLEKMKKQVTEVFSGNIPFYDFKQNLESVSSPLCGSLWKNFLKQRTQDEVVEVNAQVRNPKASSFTLNRYPVADSQQRLFAQKDVQPIHDKLILEVRDSKKPEVVIAQKTSEQSTDSETVVVKLPEDSVRAQVKGPSTDPSTDRHVYPRPIKFLLTGIDIQYDSRTDSIEGTQGVEWRIEGDKYGRSLAVVLKHEKSRFFLIPSIGGKLPLAPSGSSLFFEENTSVQKIEPNIPMRLGIETVLTKPQELWVVASTGYSQRSFSILAPEGFEMGVTLSRNLLKRDESKHGYKTEGSLTFFKPLATLTTLSSTFRIGAASELVDVASDYTPGAPANSLLSKNYASSNLELQGVLAHDLKRSVFDVIVLEHVVFYGAHNLAIDLRRFGTVAAQYKNSQSIQTGIRLFGSFFGSNNQSLSFNLSRGLDKNPQNVYSIGLGR